MGWISTKIYTSELILRFNNYQHTFANRSHVKYEFTNTKKLLRKVARTEASSICRQQFANVFADCFYAVFKTSFCPRSEASRANMLVLRTWNFQGATIRPIVPRHKHCIVFIAGSPLNFLQCASSKIILNYFQLFQMKAVKVKCKIWRKKNRQKPGKTPGW